MSNEDEVRIAEIQEDPAYWEGDKKLVDEMQELIARTPDQSLGETPHQRQIREWGEERKDPTLRRKTDNAPPVRKTKEGGYKEMSWGDEVPEDETIDKRPDLYEFKENEDVTPLTREEDLELVETAEDIKEFYKKYEDWDMTDGDIEDINTFYQLAEALDLDEGMRKAMWASYVGSEYRSKVYTVEECEAELVKSLGEKVANNVIERALRAIGDLPDSVKIALESRNVGNNPMLIMMLSGLMDEGWGGAIDDLSYLAPPPPDMD